jgi:transcriptional regulator with XRE-family HTH domain
MTQADLGERVGATRQTITVIEAEKYAPSLELALKLARVRAYGRRRVPVPRAGLIGPHPARLASMQAFEGFARTLGTSLLDGLAGFVAGLLVLTALTLIKRARGAR